MRDTEAGALRASGQGGDCSLALLAHLGPPMMSFPIKIIGLDRKQKSFHVRCVQKYETNYYLGSSSCLLEKKAKGILLFLRG